MLGWDISKREAVLQNTIIHWKEMQNHCTKVASALLRKSEPLKNSNLVHKVAFPSQRKSQPIYDSFVRFTADRVIYIVPIECYISRHWLEFVKVNYWCEYKLFSPVLYFQYQGCSGEVMQNLNCHAKQLICK